jgi:hypothetical protein
MTALLRQSATWKFVHHLCHVEVCGNLSESTWCQPNPALGEMTARDDFSQKTKRFVALRAGYMCSFAGCSQLTTGPSDESSWAVAGIGDAAHICAASPGGKRYDASMSPKERSHIDNAIWLCANHARLIDKDDVAYTADDLRQMKRAHEAACAEKVRWSKGQSVPVDDLIALGPRIVAIGEILAFDGSSWDILLRHFVIGDVRTLIGYADSFASARDGDRYVLVNAIGDGRELTAAPAVTRTESGYQVRCSVAPYLTPNCGAATRQSVGHIAQDERSLCRKRTDCSRLGAALPAAGGDELLFNAARRKPLSSRLSDPARRIL